MCRGPLTFVRYVSTRSSIVPYWYWVPWTCYVCTLHTDKVVNSPVLILGAMNLLRVYVTFRLGRQYSRSDTGCRGPVMCVRYVPIRSSLVPYWYWVPGPVMFVRYVPTRSSIVPYWYWVPWTCYVCTLHTDKVVNSPVLMLGAVDLLCLYVTYRLGRQ